MSSSAVLAGLGLAAVGIAGRAVIPLLRSAARAVENPEASKAAASAALPKMPEMKLPNWLYTDNLKFEKGECARLDRRPDCEAHGELVFRFNDTSGWDCSGIHAIRRIQG